MFQRTLSLTAFAKISQKYVYLYHVFFYLFSVQRHHHKEDSTLVPLTPLQSQRGNNLLKTVCFTCYEMTCPRSPVLKIITIVVYVEINVHDMQITLESANKLKFCT